MTDFSQARTHMVDCQIHTAGVVNPGLLKAFETIPRESFVPEELQNVAYLDEEIILGNNRFLLEPLTLSKMLQAVEPKEDDVVLDIGGTTGYSAAILSPLVSTIVALENDKSFFEHAAKTWESLDACNIVGVTGDLEKGDAQNAPFDLILINGAVAEIPKTIEAQLAPGGRLIAIVKNPGESLGQVTLLKNSADNHVSSINLFSAGGDYLPGFEPRPAFKF